MSKDRAAATAWGDMQTASIGVFGSLPLPSGPSASPKLGPGRVRPRVCRPESLLAAGRPVTGMGPDGKSRSLPGIRSIYSARPPARRRHAQTAHGVVPSRAHGTSSCASEAHVGTTASTVLRAVREHCAETWGPARARLRPSAYVRVPTGCRQWAGARTNIRGRRGGGKERRRRLGPGALDPDPSLPARHIGSRQPASTSRTTCVSVSGSTGFST